MQHKVVYCLILLLACKSVCMGQIPLNQFLRDRQEIVFDTGGRMISFPSVYVINNTTPVFKVKIPYGVFLNQLNQFKSMLVSTQSFLTNDSVVGAYTCFFNTATYTRFQQELDDKINRLTKENICSLISSYGTSSGSADKKPAKASEKPRAAGDSGSAPAPPPLKQATDEFIPLGSFLDNMLRQYEVRVYKGGVCVQAIPLTAVGVNCKDSCIYCEAATLKRIGQMECKTCAADLQPNFRFELVEQNPWNKTIRDWYGVKTKELLDAKIKMATYLKALNDASTAKTASDLDKALLNLAPLKEWFLNWFWFSKGSLVLDPFSLPSRGKQAELTSSIARLDKQISNVQEEKNFLDSAQTNLKESLDNLAAFHEIRKKATTQQELSERYNTEKERLQQQLAAGKTITQLKTIRILYKGELVLSSVKNKNPQKQFDAAFGYRPVVTSRRMLQKVTEIPENEKLQLLVHNIGQDRQIRFDERRLNFSDQEEFTTFLGEALSKIDIGSSVTAAALGSLQDFAKSFLQAGRGQQNKFGSVGASDACWKIQPYLADLVDELSDGSVSFPPSPALFAKLVESDPVFRTELKAAAGFEAPYRDSINIREKIKKDSADVAKTFVKVGKLRFVQPAAGIAFTRNPVTVTTIDTARNGFAVNTADNKAVAIIGFKLYPFRNYNRDHGIIPRYFLRRLSGFGGFEALHPLNNFYWGGAYDIVPGLAVMTGENYYLRTGYKVENNAVTGTSRSYKKSGLYYAVTVNPVVFVQFVKLLFK